MKSGATMSFEKFKGVITALITPFKNGEVDYDSLSRLVKSQISNGIDGFVIHGTTGESPTVTKTEKEKIFKFVKNLVPKDFPLIVGTGTNSTNETIEMSKAAKEWGADAALVVVPYYNKPPQRGLFKHFTETAEKGGLPVILYNVPSRTITQLSVETIVELSKNKNIIGIKEASGNIDFDKQIRNSVRKDFVLLSGDDGTYEEFCAIGGDGVISVASHLLPTQFKKKKIKEYSKLIDLLFIEANPIPLKAALKFLNVIDSAELRLPLVELENPQLQQLKDEMTRMGIKL